MVYADYHYASVHTWTTGGDTYTTTTESIYFTGTDYTQCDIYVARYSLGGGRYRSHICGNGATQIFYDGSVNPMFCGLYMINPGSAQYNGGCGHKRTVTTTHVSFVSVQLHIFNYT